MFWNPKLVVGLSLQRFYFVSLYNAKHQEQHRDRKGMRATGRVEDFMSCHVLN